MSISGNCLENSLFYSLSSQMDVGARNQLLECNQCHSLYHQECHYPAVTQAEAEKSWACQNCKSKKAPATPSSSPSRSSSPTRNKSSYSSSSKVNKHSGQSAMLLNYSCSHNSVSGGSSMKSSSSHGLIIRTSSSSSSSSSTSSKKSGSPNINIISADKRLQIMKKKAAKMREKKKHSPH